MSAPKSNLKVIGVRYTSSVTSHGWSSSSPNSPRKAVACAYVGVAALRSRTVLVRHTLA